MVYYRNDPNKYVVKTVRNVRDYHAIKRCRNVSSPDCHAMNWCKNVPGCNCGIGLSGDCTAGGMRPSSGALTCLIFATT